MIIKDLKDYDTVNYKKPSIFIACPHCTFKCNCGKSLCQNQGLDLEPNVVVKDEDIIALYSSNPLTKAIVFGGLEPLDSIEELYQICAKFREFTFDDIIIYTGYTEQELEEKQLMPIINEYWPQLKHLKNIIVKFGRYYPNEKEHFDAVLGVNLASSNQYAKLYEE